MGKLKLALLKIKNALLAFGSFLKKHWTLLGLSLVSVGAFLLVEHKDDLLKHLESEREKAAKDHNDTVAALQTEIEQEIQKRQEIQKQYNDLVTMINQQHDAAVQTIAADKEKDIKDIIARNNGNPEAIASSINSLFGIPVMTLPPSAS